MPEARDDGGVIPARAGALALLGEVGGSGYRRAPSLVRRPDGQTVQLTPLLYHVLEAIDGVRDVDAIAADVGVRSGRFVTPDDIRFLLEKRLRPLGLLQEADGTDPVVAKASPLLALRLKCVVSNPAITQRVATPFAVLFHPAVVLALVSTFAASTWWLVFEKGLASAARQALYQPSLLLLVLALSAASAGFHELGHAAACRRGGATPGAIGVGLYLVWPAFYTDVTDSYRLNRGGRLRVDLGGLYFNAIFGVAVFVAWTVLGADALLLVIAAQLLQMARQLVPFVRFDGYHILADITGVPDLFHHIGPTLHALLPSRRRTAGASALRPWARTIVVAWVAAVVPLLMSMLVLMVVALPRIAGTAADSIGLQWAALEANRDDAAEVAVSLLRILMLGLPVFGIIYILARLVRRTTRRVWLTTAGRPALRVTAGGVGLLMLTGIAYAWWPGAQYTPIGPQETWRLSLPPLSQLHVGGEAVRPTPVQATQPTARPVVLAVVDASLLPVLPPPLSSTNEILALPTTLGVRTAPPPPAPAAASATSTDLPRGSPSEPPPAPPAPSTDQPPANSDPPADEVPVTPPVPPTEPLSAPVLEPATPPDAPPAAPPAPPAEPPSAAEAAPTWPFPWAPPLPAHDGDTRAYAVTTEDGSTATDVQVSFLWAPADRNVEQRNEAYAFASCSGCRSTAIAFQVIFVVGYNDVIAPANAAVSASYRCDHCVTHALAIQLVVPLTRRPNDETMAELTRLEAALVQARATLASMPIEQAYAVLVAVRTRVLMLLAAEGASTATESVDTGTVETVDTGTVETPIGSAVPSTTTSPTTVGMTTTTTPATSTVGMTTTMTPSNSAGTINTTPTTTVGSSTASPPTAGTTTAPATPTATTTEQAASVPTTTTAPPTTSTSPPGAAEGITGDSTSTTATTGAGDPVSPATEADTAGP